MESFWHSECIYLLNEKVFVERYRKLCKRKNYHFSYQKANNNIESLGHIVTLPKNSNTKLLITTAAKQLTVFKCQLAVLKKEMVLLAKQLPEYDTVINLYDVGDITAVQLIAEIGDVGRFPNRNALVSFAGVDPCVDQSGKHNSRSNPTTKRGSSHLRRTLFQVITTYVKQRPLNEPVYQFLCKKRSEGKPFYVCTTAATNKFLRIYYARVKKALSG